MAAYVACRWPLSSKASFPLFTCHVLIHQHNIWAKNTSFTLIEHIIVQSFTIILLFRNYHMKFPFKLRSYIYILKIQQAFKEILHT